MEILASMDREPRLVGQLILAVAMPCLCAASHKVGTLIRLARLYEGVPPALWGRNIWSLMTPCRRGLTPVTRLA